MSGDDKIDEQSKTEIAKELNGIEDRAAGYRCPPAEHKFKKGVSGNPRGRPHKVERAFTPRQIRRDILSVAEAPMTIRTEKGKKKTTVVQVVFLRLVARALAGHGPSIRLVLKPHAEKIKEHCEIHDDKFKILEVSEMLLSENPGSGIHPEIRAQMNRYRKATRIP